MMTKQRRMQARQEGVLHKTPILTQTPIFTQSSLCPANPSHSSLFHWNLSHSPIHSALSSPTLISLRWVSHITFTRTNSLLSIINHRQLHLQSSYLYCVAIEKRGRRGVWGWSVWAIPPGVAPAGGFWWYLAAAAECRWYLVISDRWKVISGDIGQVPLFLLVASAWSGSPIGEPDKA